MMVMAGERWKKIERGGDTNRGNPKQVEKKEKVLAGTTFLVPDGEKGKEIFERKVHWGKEKKNANEGQNKKSCQRGKKIEIGRELERG